LTIPPRPSSLFSPYTTLFRSRQLETFYGTILACAGFAVWALFSLLPAIAGYGIREGWDTPLYWVVGLPLLLVLHGIVGAVTDGLDRKSTRLNSSHVKISYAVF